MHQGPSTKPEWDRLHEVAAEQSGYFTAQQAATAGYSTYFLRKHVRSGHIEREQRGIYRLVPFPEEHDAELVPTWLMTRREGVLSHDTALSLYNICDILPSRLHITLPTSWGKRRVPGLPSSVLYYADIAEADRTLLSGVPITGYRRTLEDCAARRILPDLLRQAAREAIGQGYVRPEELVEVQRALQPFGGI